MELKSDRKNANQGVKVQAKKSFTKKQSVCVDDLKFIRQKNTKNTVQEELIEMKQFLINATDEEVNFDNPLTCLNLIRIIRKPIYFRSNVEIEFTTKVLKNLEFYKYYMDQLTKQLRHQWIDNIKDISWKQKYQHKKIIKQQLNDFNVCIQKLLNLERLQKGVFKKENQPGTKVYLVLQKNSILSGENQDKMGEGSELGLELLKEQEQQNDKNKKYNSDSKCISSAFVATISINQLQNNFQIQQRRLNDEIIQGLSCSHLFKDWNLIGMKALVRKFQFKEYTKDQIIFQKGDPINQVYFVYNGEVSIQQLSLQNYQRRDNAYKNQMDDRMVGSAQNVEELVKSKTHIFNNLDVKHMFSMENKKNYNENKLLINLFTMQQFQLFGISEYILENAKCHGYQAITNCEITTIISLNLDQFISLFKCYGQMEMIRQYYLDKLKVEQKQIDIKKNHFISQNSIDFKQDIFYKYGAQIDIQKKLEVKYDLDYDNVQQCLHFKLPNKVSDIPFMNKSKNTIRKRQITDINSNQEKQIKEDNMFQQKDIMEDQQKSGKKRKGKNKKNDPMIQVEYIDYAKKSTVLMNQLKQNEKKLNQLSHTNYDNNLRNVFKIKYDKEFLEQREQMKRISTKEVNNQVKELESQVLKKTNDYFKWMQSQKKKRIVRNDVKQKVQPQMQQKVQPQIQQKNNMKQENKVLNSYHQKSTEASNSIKMYNKSNLHLKSVNTCQEQQEEDLGLILKTSEWRTKTSEVKREQNSLQIKTQTGQMRPSSSMNMNWDMNSRRSKIVKFTSSESVDDLQNDLQNKQHVRRKTNFKQMIEDEQNEKQYFHKEKQRDTTIVEIYKKTKSRLMDYNQKKMLVKKLGLCEMIEPDILDTYVKKYNKKRK